jgi:glycosyltransferase involved in cell wall biosynthesis
LADKITALLTDKEWAARIGQLNRQRIREEFSIEGMCDFFMALINGASPR